MTIFPVALVSSTLGQTMLLAYGDVLLRNGKYRYAISAMQAA
eukprot:CAMPEP_0198325316 /NCGR_PEP_ID=MMETSP1450-20131203/13086_1 /TAXON_ID=753684 ORGANISM="Madagascaria erythrocladiodes, Strain CCMP3234" /NCGR_SAMPLE_ID=MMETSP1450 /ASSEMBLY_ACC=CAM_ASM_001115 /LENGTH=41 /DNA_ID= /DNA_START= /DNA_END= /DNA_ORIENTATION=